MPTFAQYLRIEKRAGGIKASRAGIVRASHKVLGPRGRSHHCRKQRHAWIQGHLAHYDNARGVARQYGAL